MAATMPDKDGFGSDFKNVCSGRIPKRMVEASNLVHSSLFPREISNETWKVPEVDFGKALKNVEKLIEREWAVALAVPLDDGQACGQARFVLQFGLHRYCKSGDDLVLYSQALRMLLSKQFLPYL